MNETTSKNGNVGTGDINYWVSIVESLACRAASDALEASRSGKRSSMTDVALRQQEGTELLRLAVFLREML